MKVTDFAKDIYLFFKDGFAAMTVGRTLWVVVLIKLFIMFAILKVFFFPNYLNSHFDNDADRAAHVRTELLSGAGSE